MLMTSGAVMLNCSSQEFKASQSHQHVGGKYYSSLVRMWVNAEQTYPEAEKQRAYGGRVNELQLQE